MKSLGKHILVDFHDCEAGLLNDRERLRAALLDAVRRSGATIVTDILHQFNPHGLSGVVVIAESHVAVHTWPEHSCASVDIFSCSDRMDSELIVRMLGGAFGARRIVRQDLERGKMPPGRDLPHGPGSEALTGP